MEPTKTTSADELNILDVISSIYQLDIVSLRQVFLLLAKNFYVNPKAFSPCGINVPPNIYNYTYSDPLVDPKSKVPSTIDIELDYSSSINSIDKTDYLKSNNKPAIFISIKDFQYQPYGILNDVTRVLPNEQEQAVNCTTSVVFSHYANNYDDAAILGYLTMSYFTAMKDYLKRALPIIKFIPVSLSSPVPASDVDSYEDKAQKYFRSDATFNIIFESNWRVKEEAVLLKKYSINIKNGVTALEV